MIDKTFVPYFRRLNDTCGFGLKGQHFFGSHALRKFFALTLKNNGFNYLDAEWLLGRKLPTSIVKYIKKPEIERLKKEYLEVLPHLCIGMLQSRTIESEVDEGLKNERKRLGGDSGC